jgi:thiol:disulfide interchange protein DsbD
MSYYWGYKGAAAEGLPPAHKNDLAGGLKAAEEANQLVFLDFTGYTCGNCRWMEENIFTRPEVQKELGKFTRVVLYTDEENEKDENGKPLSLKFQEYQEKTFGTIALPLYAVFKADGTPVQGADGKPLIAVYDTDPAVFLKFLRDAQQAGNK